MYLPQSPENSELAQRVLSTLIFPYSWAYQMVLIWRMREGKMGRVHSCWLIRATRQSTRNPATFETYLKHFPWSKASAKLRIQRSRGILVMKPSVNWTCPYMVILNTDGTHTLKENKAWCPMQHVVNVPLGALDVESLARAIICWRRSYARRLIDDAPVTKRDRQ